LAASTPHKPSAERDWDLTRFQLHHSAGRVADFHALRHTAGSLLAAAGVHPKVAQAVMRHSDMNLTLSRYSHVYAGQETDAVAALPDLSAPASESTKATGTDDATAQAAQDAAGRPKSGDRAQARPTERPAPRRCPQGQREARARLGVLLGAGRLIFSHFGARRCTGSRTDRREEKRCRTRENRDNHGRNARPERWPSG